MLSDRERKWVAGGGIALFCILYLWLVFFPLVSYHRKMQRRIKSSWKKMATLRTELDVYLSVSWGVASLIRRAQTASQGVPAGRQLKLLVRKGLGNGGTLTPIVFDPVWEGQDCVLRRCVLRGRAAPKEIFHLIDRIDRHYLPMRVVKWDMKKTAAGLFEFEMEVYLLEAREKP